MIDPFDRPKQGLGAKMLQFWKTTAPGKIIPGALWFDGAKFNFHSASGLKSLLSEQDFKGSLVGCQVEYVSPSSVKINPRKHRDITHVAIIHITTAQTVSISSNGANGLDTGSEATNSWYYLWAIGNSTTGAVAGLLSLSNSSPTMPSGFDKKHLLPIVVRNNGASDIIPFYLGAWGHFATEVLYDVAFSEAAVAGATQILNGGTQTSFTSVGASAYIPPVSSCGIFNAGINGNGAGAWVRPADITSHTGLFLSSGTSALGISDYGKRFAMRVDSSQQIQYKRSGSTLTLDVAGFKITQI